MTEKVQEALRHVVASHPEVVKVRYHRGMWLYTTKTNWAPSFGPEIDGGLLEDAASSVEEETATFYLEKT